MQGVHPSWRTGEGLLPSSLNQVQELCFFFALPIGVPSDLFHQTVLWLKTSLNLTDMGHQRHSLVQKTWVPVALLALATRGSLCYSR